MKNKKRVFLSLGVFILAIPPIASIISCGDNSKIKKNSLKDISVADIAKMGGIFGPKAKENDYELIKRFVSSLTNEKGSIFKMLSSFEKNLNGFKLKKALKELNGDNLFKLLKLFYETGFKEMKSSDLQMMKELIAVFVNDSSKLSKIELYINMLKDLIDANNFKKYIIGESGFSNVIKRFSSNSIISLFESIIGKMEYGFNSNDDSGENYDNSNYKNKMLEFLLTQLRTIDDNSTTSKSILNTILGLSEEVGNLGDLTVVSTSTSQLVSKSLFKTLKEEIFSEYSTWSNVRLREIKNNKVAILRDSQNKLLKKYFDSLITQTEKTKKEKDAETQSSSFIPFKKGFLNANENEIRQNLIFFQSTLQRFLLYFAFPENIDSTINNMKQTLTNENDRSSDVFEKIKTQIEDVVSKPIFWRIASSDLTKYAIVFYKIINGNIDKFAAFEINGFLHVLLILDGKIYLKDEKFYLKDGDIYLDKLLVVNEETKILREIFLNGFSKITNSQKHLDNAIQKILKLSSNSKNIHIWNILKGMIFQF